MGVNAGALVRPVQLHGKMGEKPQDFPQQGSGLRTNTANFHRATQGKIVEHAAVDQQGGGVEPARLQILQRQGMAAGGQGEISAVLNEKMDGPQNRRAQTLIGRHQRAVEIAGKENALKTHESILRFFFIIAYMSFRKRQNCAEIYG